MRRFGKGRSIVPLKDMTYGLIPFNVFIIEF